MSSYEEKLSEQIASMSRDELEEDLFISRNKCLSLESQLTEKDKEIQRLKMKVNSLLLCKSCKCGDVGFFIVGNSYSGEPEQEQCEFCYTNENSRFKAITQNDKHRLASVKADAIEEMVASLIMEESQKKWKGIEMLDINEIADYADSLRKSTELKR